MVLSLKQKAMSKSYNGYLVVASNRSSFYSVAINLLESIRDYYPEANLCLVTEERFCDGRETVADHVIHCDNHYRAKLWGMSQTPFDKTFYIDADMECVSEDIANVFDELKGDDMVFTGLPRDRWYAFKDTEFPGGTFKLCGGVCLYDSSNPLVMEFMHDWFEYYDKQYNGIWWPTDENGHFDKKNYPHHLKIWDQFTLWWLTEREEKYKELNVRIFDNDLRWNYWVILDRKRNPMPEDVVLLHYSSAYDKYTEYQRNVIGG